MSDLSLHLVKKYHENDLSLLKVFKAIPLPTLNTLFGPPNNDIEPGRFYELRYFLLLQLSAINIADS